MILDAYQSVFLVILGALAAYAFLILLLTKFCDPFHAKESIMHYQYPTLDQAIESGKVVLSKFNGVDVHVNELVHSVYTVEGFGLSIAFPQGVPPRGAVAAIECEPCTKDECQKYLEGFVASASAPVGARGALALPWLKILASFKLLLDLWTK